MFRKILFCYDGTAEGRRALRQGGEIAVAVRAETYLLAICRKVIVPVATESVTHELLDSEEQTARTVLREGIEKLRERGLTAEGSLVYGDPLEHIPLVAAHLGADLVVIGHRQRGRLARYWTQSLEESLLYRLSCSILIAVAPHT